jgi:predicted nucleotidyltransferase
MGNIFNEDFREFLIALNKAEVKYVLVGGYAVIFHGFPRTTGDMDIFVQVSKDNYEKICTAFKLYNMPVFDMTENNFLLNKSINVFSFGRPPVSIEILKEISGVSFEEAYNNAIETVFDKVPVKIINLNNLIKNKRASARPKDINDLSNLE